MSAPAPTNPEWGTCTLCGDAVPPTTRQCPTCGYDRPVQERDRRSLPKRTGRWVTFVRTLRVLVVVGIIVGLAYAMISSTLQGPPVLNDPLTTAGSYFIGPGNYTQISGNITGEDFVVGNYTVVNPIGLNVSFAVYNSTEYAMLQVGENATPAQTLPTSDNGRIIFAAPYTDMFYFVFTNPYHHGPQLVVYVTTSYEPNVEFD